MYSPCKRCGSTGYCKHNQVLGTRSGMGQKKVEKELITRDPKHNKARSQTQERNIAKDYKEAGFEKSHRIPMSGAIATMKGDVDPGDMFLVEAKQTRSGKILIEPAWVKKIKEEAELQSRDWILHAHVAEGEGNFIKVVCLDEEVWMDIIRRLKAAEEELESQNDSERARD